MIYLDHHAATPLSAAVRVAMERYEGWANPSSAHRYGRAAKEALEAARDRVAAAVSANPADIIFTAGGTEACNLGVLGLGQRVGRVLSSEIEHPAMAGALSRLQERGVHVERFPVRDGTSLDAEAWAAALDGDVGLVAVQWVNHETGTVLPVERIAAACLERDIPLVVDATQALGKLPVDISKLGASAIALASHKIGGPAGAGALWLKRGVDCDSHVIGGGQERGRRAGTPDVRALVGFGAACERVGDRLATMSEVTRRRDRLESGLVGLGGVVNGDSFRRVGTVANLSFLDWRGDQLVAALDVEGLCVASGAACSAGIAERSPVIHAMYPDEPWRAASSLRLSLGPETTEEDVSRALQICGDVIPRASRGA